MKLRNRTKHSPLCPFIIRMESFSASVAVTSGQSARMYGHML